LKDVRPDAFPAHGRPVITGSPGRRALCAPGRVNPRPESSNPSGPRVRPPPAARRATGRTSAFHASGHCRGHAAHQQRTPAFARLSGRPRVHLSDARSGRRSSGSCRKTRAVASLGGSEREPLAWPTHSEFVPSGRLASVDRDACLPIEQERRPRVVFLGPVWPSRKGIVPADAARRPAAVATGPTPRRPARCECACADHAGTTAEAGSRAPARTSRASGACPRGPCDRVGPGTNLVALRSRHRG
jgi:hypothetical protein